MGVPDASSGSSGATRVPLRTIVREWGRIGVIGFGGPPAHIALLRRLCVTDRAWLSDREFEDGIAAVNLLPGPASTQLAIFCAWRLRRTIGAIVGGLCFILPGLVVILALSVLFFAAHPPLVVEGVAAGMSAVVPAIALHASIGLMPGSWRRCGDAASRRARWLTYLVLGAVSAATIGPYLVLVLLFCGVVEIAAFRRTATHAFLPPLLGTAAVTGGLGALSWVAFKVGALSYGGGFVIVPLMQHDAVSTYHWMSGAQFLNAVALGQVTPGPVTHTVAAVGYAASGLGGGLLAALVAFAPSFAFVLVGAPHFDRIRHSMTAQAFLTGAGAAAIGAIAGSSVSLALELGHLWQVALLAAGLCWLIVARRGLVTGVLLAGAIGAAAALAGAPIPR